MTSKIKYNDTNKSNHKNSPIIKHNFIEDGISIIQAIIIFSLGVYFFKKSATVAGGTTGIALILSYTFNYTIGALFFFINLPFYFIALFRVGFVFFIKTIITVLLVSTLIDNLDSLIYIEITNRLFGSVLAGLLCGVGILILLRHNSSVGGFTILVRYIQDKFGVNGSKILLGIDSTIMFICLYLFDMETVLYSTLSLAIVNLVLILNNKPGRYNI